MEHTNQQTQLVQEEQAEAAVRKGFCLAMFVKPIPSRNKEDVGFISLDISFPLSDEHRKNGVLPDEVVEAWDALQSGGLDGAVRKDIDPHDVKLRLVPDDDSEELVIKCASIDKAQISVVEAKGTGEAREVTRLQLRITTDFSKRVWEFCGNYFGRVVWIRLIQAQGKLIQ